MGKRSHAILLLAVSCLHAATHLTIYQEEGRYGGWPANHGIWSWGNEIVVGFSAAYYKRQTPGRHQYDNTKPEEPRLARSLDGGETWAIEAPKSLLPPEQGGAEVTDLPAPMDFQHPGFAMTVRFADSNKGPSRLWYSTDRGKSWRGPYRFPDLGQPGIAARTDYLINGKRDAVIFLTAAKQNHREGRVICARTQDGALHWQFVSYVGDEPAGFSIMPSSVRISPSRIVTAVRVREPPDQTSIDVYESMDNAATWHILPRPVPDTGGRGGNPPSMIRLRDGRLCLTYGYRAKPYELRARLSGDAGKTWSDEVSLRSDAPTWEVGYPRTVQRTDGKVVTIYYWAGTIAATIWDPDEIVR